MLHDPTHTYGDPSFEVVLSKVGLQHTDHTATLQGYGVGVRASKCTHSYILHFTGRHTVGRKQKPSRFPYNLHVDVAMDSCSD